MKKILTLLALCSLSFTLSAQLVGGEQLLKMKESVYGNRTWKEAARLIYSSSKLDENKALKYVKVIELPQKGKDQIFDNISTWVLDKFGGSDCDIRVMDQAKGLILAQGSVRDVVEHDGWNNSYTVSLAPVLRIECKDGRARITVTASTYNIHREHISGSLFSSNTHNDEVWSIANCWPFSDTDPHEKTSAKAFVMTHLCANVYVQLSESALRTEHQGNTSRDNW